MASRSLTPGEINLAKTFFGDSLNYSLIKVHDESYIFFQPDRSGMTPNGEIYMSGAAYKGDYSKETIGKQGFFLHEMTHVWQYQNNVLNPIGAALDEVFKHLGDYDAAYPYTLVASKDFLDYGMEQQASILEDYFRLINGWLPGNLENKSLSSPRRLYEQVLAKFLNNPKYAYKAKRTFTPRRMPGGGQLRRDGIVVKSPGEM